jgi:hypothetical protein
VLISDGWKTLKMAETCSFSVFVCVTLQAIDLFIFCGHQTPEGRELDPFFLLVILVVKNRKGKAK